MLLGMKVGPQKQSFHDVSQVRPPFVEVWFNICRASEYTELFNYLKARNIKIALHFWGTLPDGLCVNIAYPDPTILKASMELYRRSIDIAASYDGLYVNIHPGASALVRMDIEREIFSLASDPEPQKRSQEVFLEHALALHAYAAKLGIFLTVETVPLRVYNYWSTVKDRTQSFSVHELTIDALVRFQKAGGYVANDFSHTAAGIITQNQYAVRRHLIDSTRALRSGTRLIHLGFIVPPYNGTDFHDQLDNQAFTDGNAVPDAALTKELLGMFAGRNDIYALAEPSWDHPKNFFLAKGLLESI